MAVTIQQIAELAGVSRGTVDRALNNRGRINPEVAEKIWYLADELGYIAKKRKQRVANSGGKLGVVTQLSESSFMININKGISKAGDELADQGITLCMEEVVSVDEEEQLHAIDTLLEEEIEGLAIMPVESEKVREKLNRIIEEKHIPVITFNSDIVGVKRKCFVGMDNRKSGRTAAGLMGMLTRGQGKILVITGYFTNSVNNSRVEGFIEEIKKTYPQMMTAGVYASFDEADEVERIIENAMVNISEIEGIFVASSGQAGIEKAFAKLKLKRRPYVVIYDQTPENERALKLDVADFLIDQNGYIQGYQALYILVNMLWKGIEPKKEFIYTDINIKTKHNI